jgi:hypothetical protein
MQLTKSHLAKKPVVDLTSEEVVHGIKELSGWLSKVNSKEKEVDTEVEER